MNLARLLPVAGLLFLLSPCAAESPSQAAPTTRAARPNAAEPDWPAPTPETAAWLDSTGLSAKNAAANPARADLAPGDTCLFLMTIERAGKARQYLVEIRADTADGKEKSGFTMQPFSMFTNTGHRIDYGVRPVALVVTITGPIEGNKEPKVRTSRAIANEEFLSQGFCDACSAFETLYSLKRTKDQAGLALASQPFPEADAAVNQEKLRAIGIVPSAEQERALGGIMPAIFSFFDLVMHTEGMSDTVEDLAAPSLALSLSMATGSVNINFNIQTDKLAHLPPASDGAPRWTMPIILSMNGTDCIAMSLYARPATPPFRVCAGLDGLIARSIRKPDRILTLHRIGAWPAPGGDRK